MNVEAKSIKKTEFSNLFQSRQTDSHFIISSSSKQLSTSYHYYIMVFVCFCVCTVRCCFALNPFGCRRRPPEDRFAITVLAN